MADRSIMLEVDGGGATFVAQNCRVDERLNQAFVARVRVIALVSDAAAAAAPLALIGKKATVKLAFHGVERSFVGLVDRVEDEETHSFVTVMARVGWLGDPRDYRVFVKQSAKDIATKVLSEHGVTLEWKASRKPPKREQCVQSFESDLGFVSRILAEEGVCWYPKAGDAKTVLAADESGTFTDLSLPLPFREEAGLEADKGVHGAELAHAARSGAASLRDYDFTHPKLELKAKDGDGPLEWYEFPGNFGDAGAGGDLAKIRLAERRAEELVLAGGSTAPELQAGGVFSLAEAPIDGMNGKWLVVAVSHHADLNATGDALAYESRFSAVPEKRGYRPARPDTSPRLGVTTATVTGASGKELHLDSHGRMHALLRWERRAAADDKSSSELRVMQPQMPGSILNPRVTWEQLVSHSDPRAEMPVALGRLYNGAQRPPASLPKEKVQTHLGTWSTPNGSKGNFAKIDDTAGKEKMLRNASNNYSEKTGNDKVRSVAVDEKRDIGAKRKHVISEIFQARVDGAHTMSIAALRKLSVNSNCQITASSEQVLVGGARLFHVAGDYVTASPVIARLVAGKKGEAAIEHHSMSVLGGNMLLVCGGMSSNVALGEHVGVGGLAVVAVSGAKNINCKSYANKVRGIFSETLASLDVTAKSDIGDYYRALTLSAGDTTYKAGEIAIEATSTLKLKAGSCTITMTSSSINVDGGFEGMVASVESGDHKYG